MDSRILTDDLVGYSYHCWYGVSELRRHTTRYDLGNTTPKLDSENAYGKVRMAAAVRTDNLPSL